MNNGNVQPIRKDLRILRDDEAVKIGSEVGAVVFWNGHGRTSHAGLRAQWLAAGMDVRMLLELPSPKVALRRAIHDMEEAHILARRLKETWILKRERAVENETDLAYETEAKVSLDEVGQLVIEPENVEPALREEIESRYQVHLTQLSREDLSQWLVGLTDYVKAIPLRENGGFYFVPPAGLATWRIIARVVEAASQYEMLDIPAGRSMNVAKAVLSGLTATVDTACQEMERDLLSGDKKDRALQSRVRRCDSLLAQVEEYEGVVGRTLNDLTGKISALQDRMAMAALSMSDDG